MSEKKHVLMLLSNPFRPDPRVHREAKSLVNAGYEVTILCWDRKQRYPTEETIEILPNGKRKVTQRKVFPGYVMVKMVVDVVEKVRPAEKGGGKSVDLVMNPRAWYVVRNTPGVTGFVGIGNKPTPLRQEEVDRIMRRMEAEEPVAQVKVKVGDKVRVVEGSFTDFNGTVEEVYPDKGKARVLVSFFNRETPIEVDLLQIERL